MSVSLGAYVHIVKLIGVQTMMTGGLPLGSFFHQAEFVGE